MLLTLWFVIVEGGGELDVGIVAGCDSMQGESGAEGGLVDGGGATELKEPACPPCPWGLGSHQWCLQQLGF